MKWKDESEPVPISSDISKEFWPMLTMTYLKSQLVWLTPRKQVRIVQNNVDDIDQNLDDNPIDIECKLTVAN